MLPAYAYAIIVLGTAAWASPFPLLRSRNKSVLAFDKRARWGVLLECVGYSLLWQGHFWTRSLAIWQVVLSVLLFTLAALISWTSARLLGPQLRVEAAVNEDHRLIKTGPYAIVRHPIYTSMLCLSTATGLLITPALLFIPALFIFLIGTEIRIRIEESILAASFGTEFERYRKTIPRLIPFLHFPKAHPVSPRPRDF